ncbi:MAG TPA: peptidyl-prolyl cis-trans isomerase [Desulfomonilaceae bacterium]|nr:peptidyl-prolyl cis-trans isomerase [Desulfomonilaceae bacterium]
MFTKPSIFSSFWSALIIAMVIAAGAPYACAADNNQVLAKIGDQSLSEADLKDMANAIPERFRPISMTPEGRQKILEYMVNVYIMSGEAEKEGLDKTPEVQKMLQLTKKDLLARLYFEKAMKDTPVPTEEDAKAYFEKNRAQFVTPETVHLHHILVKTDKEAKDVMERLKKGEKFADVASQVSICPSKARGGNLEWLPKGSLVKEIEDVAFSMKPGQPVGPVQSKFGWHVLLLEDKKPAQENSFDQVKDYLLEQIRFQKQQEQYEKLADSLRKKMNVQFTAPAPETVPAPGTAPATIPGGPK